MVPLPAVPRCSTKEPPLGRFHALK
jgi:hypothetical protein